MNGCRRRVVGGTVDLGIVRMDDAGATLLSEPGSVGIASTGTVAGETATTDGDGVVHAWERWVPAWHCVFYGVLGLSTVLALVNPSTSGTERAALTGLSVLLAGWYWLWVVRRRIWALPILQVIAYFVGAATLWLLAVSLNEAYFLLAFSAYQQVFAYLPSPRSAVPGAIALTGLLLAMELLGAGGPSPLTLLIAVLAAGLCIICSLWVDAIMRQSEDRHRLIGELEATRAELAAAERDAGTLAERQRLAAEIHDTLAQGVTSVVTLLEATEAELDPGQDTARGHLDRALGTARDTLAEARRFVWALQPEALDRGSLVDALGRLADALADETGMTARFVLSGVPHQLPATVEVALLRVAQEGTANIRRHAHAGEAVLTLSFLGDRVILDVRDDGRGFDPAVAEGQGGLSGGLGLRGLRTRLAALGGGLDVESAVGEGTVLVAQVPEAEMPEAEMPEAEMPEAEMPEAEMPEPEMPEAEMPVPDMPIDRGGEG